MSIIFAAFLHNTLDRPLNALPRRGVISAKVGASTLATNVVSSSKSIVVVHSSGRAITDISWGTRGEISSLEIAEHALVSASIAMF